MKGTRKDPVCTPCEPLVPGEDAAVPGNEGCQKTTILVLYVEQGGLGGSWGSWSRGLNLCLCIGRQILYHLSHQGRPRADFKVLGLSNWMALPIIEMERLANCTAETGAQGSGHSPRLIPG